VDSRRCASTRMALKSALSPTANREQARQRAREAVNSQVCKLSEMKGEELKRWMGWSTCDQ
jgi:hypothetical protein